MVEQGVVLQLFLCFGSVPLAKSRFHLSLFGVVHYVLELPIDDHGGEELVEVAA